MKVTVALLAAVSVAAASPHAHRHARLHEKRGETTVVAYVLDGRTIPTAEANEGLRNGTLKLAPDGGIELASEEASTVSIEPATSTSAKAPAKYTESAVGSSGSSSSGSSGSSSTTGITREFPDGEISCDDFPNAYGANSVPWENLGGWTGVQTPGTTVNGLFDDIHTAISGGCTDGSYCSYACPFPYIATQWPDAQGATGQSIGGLLCKNGKLYLTNSDSNKLCRSSAPNVTVKVLNKLSKNVAICKTDYPGTESMTIPGDCEAGGEIELPVPEEDTCYKAQGMTTSAQFYANKAGISVEKACTWASPGDEWGNWAPMNFGAGWSNGRAWLSVFQNAPTTSIKQDYTVEIIGDNVSGSCKYTNGQYCGDAGCSSETGCTVSVSLPSILPSTQLTRSSGLHRFRHGHLCHFVKMQTPPPAGTGRAHSIVAIDVFSF